MTEPTFFVHESAYVDQPSEIGEGTKIWHFAHVLARTKIGRNCVLGQNVVVGPDVVVGDNCKIQNNVSIYDEVILESDVFVGPSAVFTNVYNPRAFVVRKDEYRRTLVQAGAAIGANATIVCGTTLGRYCFIAAGGVVTRDVPAYALMAGVPARRDSGDCGQLESLPGVGPVAAAAAALRRAVVQQEPVTEVVA